jgi:hypothetical protein
MTAVRTESSGAVGPTQDIARSSDARHRPAVSVVAFTVAPGASQGARAQLFFQDLSIGQSSPSATLAWGRPSREKILDAEWAHLICEPSIVYEAARATGLNIAVTWQKGRIPEGCTLHAELVEAASPAEEVELRTARKQRYEVWAAGSFVGIGRAGIPARFGSVTITLTCPAGSRLPAGLRARLIVRPMAPTLDATRQRLRVSSNRDGESAPVRVVTVELVEGPPALATEFLTQLAIAHTGTSAHSTSGVRRAPAPGPLRSRGSTFLRTACVLGLVIAGAGALAWTRSAALHVVLAPTAPAAAPAIEPLAHVDVVAVPAPVSPVGNAVPPPVIVTPPSPEVPPPTPPAKQRKSPLHTSAPAPLPAAEDNQPRANPYTH